MKRKLPQVDKTKKKQRIDQEIPFFLLDNEKKNIENEILNQQRKLDKIFKVSHQINDFIKNEKNIQKKLKNINRRKELVVIGMEGEGKSTLVENIVGFQFNSVGINNGTRRPIIIKLKKDLSKSDPNVQFRKENDVEQLENSIPSLNLIPSEIRKRTYNVCGEFNVSGKPIVMDVQHKNADFSLNIYDTPGMKREQKDIVSTRIHQILKHLISPSNRIIICVFNLQAKLNFSTNKIVELVKQVDNDFKRTIFVFTMTDLTLSRFNEYNQQIETLFGNLGTNQNVFYTVLPNKRINTMNEYHNEVMKNYLNSIKKLSELSPITLQNVKNNFGIFKFKIYLKQLLANYNKEFVGKYFEVIEKTIDSENLQILKLNSKISLLQSSHDTENEIINMIGKYLNSVKKCLKGTTKYSIELNGQTLEEEKNDSQLFWPNYKKEIKSKINVKNEGYKILGGSQIDRLLNEFEIVSLSQEFPHTSDDEVAVSIGIGIGGTELIHGATDLAERKSRMIFLPIIDMLMKKTEYVISRIFKIVVNDLQNQSFLEEGEKINQFYNELSKCSNIFIQNLIKDVKNKLVQQFDEFSKMIDFDLLTSVLNENEGKNKSNYDLLNPSKKDTIQRIKQMNQINSELNNFKLFENSGIINNDVCKKIKIFSAKIFNGIRNIFVKFVKSKYNSCFILPLFGDLDQYVRKYVLNFEKENIKIMLGDKVPILQKEKNAITNRIEIFKKSLNLKKMLNVDI